MALEQTVILRKNLLTCAPKNLISNSRTPSLWRNPQSLSKTETKKYKRLGIKCSFGWGDNSENGLYDRYSSPQYQRPSEIQWKKDLCNLVQLIGVVGTPVQIKHLTSGKAVAWTRLAVKKAQNDVTWISLTFWDELAHIAFQHVEKGQQIYVSGRLVSDIVEDEGKQQTYYKVVVQQMNFIEKSSFSGSTYDGDSNIFTPGKKQKSYAGNSGGSMEELWQAFFANPAEWWDNRKNKRNPNYPDFKHKDTGEALWVEGRYNPPWVKSQLAVLDSKMESFRDQNGSLHVNFMGADSLSLF